MAKEKTDLMEALAAASEEDLQAVEERIAELGKELESLRQVEKILGRRIRGKPERAAAGTTGKLAGRIVEAIKEDGPATVDDLAATLDAKPQAIRTAITRAGKQFVLVGGNRYQVSLPPRS